VHTAADYRERAARFRALAKESDEPIAELMEKLAKDYDELARRVERNGKPKPSPPR
jgi:hypothetical protein